MKFKYGEFRKFRAVVVVLQLFFDGKKMNSKIIIKSVIYTVYYAKMVEGK